jgi:hypothetical protein
MWKGRGALRGLCAKSETSTLVAHCLTLTAVAAFFFFEIVRRRTLLNIKAELQNPYKDPREWEELGIVCLHLARCSG